MLLKSFLKLEKEVKLLDEGIEIAVKTGRWEYIEWDIKNKSSSYNLLNPEGQTILEQAQNKYWFLEKLLDSGKVDVNVSNRQGENILFSLSDPMTAKLVLQKGINVNHLSSDGSTPLHNCSPNIASLLLDNGADIFIRNDFGDLPLHSMVRQKNYSYLVCCRMLNIDPDDGEILKRFININECGGHGQTLLHMAVLNKDYLLIPRLLKNGTNIEVRDDFNKSVLDYLQEIGDKKILDIFKMHKLA